MMLTQRLLTALAVALLLLGEIGVEGFAGEPFAEDPGTSAMYAVDLDGANLRRLPQIPKYTVLGSPDISPDGRWIGLDGWKQGEGTSDAHLLFVELETKEFRDLGPGAMPTWSADGKRFVYSSYTPRGVFVGSFEGEERELIDEDGWGIQWSPDGKSAVYTRYQQGGCQLIVYDFATGQRRGLFDDNDLPYQTIYWNSDWSPDSTQVCIVGVRQNGTKDISLVTVEESDGPAQVEWLCDASELHNELAWHPTEPFIAVPGLDNCLHRINLFGAQRPIPFPGQPADRTNNGICWTPDGKSMIFTSVSR